MTIRINWTSEAEKTFNQNLEYLSKEWSGQEVSNFLDRLEEIIETIRSNPKLYPLYRINENVHKCVMHERIILYYKIVDEETVDSLTFWNTYQNPINLNL